MKSEKLFRWKNFRNHVSETCKINYAWDRFTDMTFIVQKKRVTAHKIILSANSEFFKMILDETPLCVHPTITLPDVNYEDLDAIMQFIYTGELLVQHDRLESVLSLASCLQVKSLMKVQAALLKQNKGNKAFTGNICHMEDISASCSMSEPKLETFDIVASSSQTQPKMETLDILASISQCQPKLEISDVSASSSKSQPMLEISDVIASSLQSHPALEISDIVVASCSQSQTELSPEDEEQDLDMEKTQKKKKAKGNFKNLVGKEKVGQTSSITAPVTGSIEELKLPTATRSAESHPKEEPWTKTKEKLKCELKKKKGKKPGAPRSELLVVGGKPNNRGLAPKTGIARRSSHKSIKEKLLREFEKGGTIKEVSKLFDISPSCAFYYKKCFVKAGKLSPSMINYQKKSLYKNNRNKKTAEKTRVIDCRPSQSMVTAT